MTIIQVLATDGTIERKASYTVETKRALIAWIMQYTRNNWNSWDYPSDLEGIRELGPNRFYYTLSNGDIVGALPEKV